MKHIEDAEVTTPTIFNAWNAISIQIQRIVMKFYYPDPNLNYVPVEKQARSGLPLDPEASELQYHYLNCWGNGLNAMKLSDRTRSTVFRYLFGVALAQPVFGLHELDNHDKDTFVIIEKGLQGFEELLTTVDIGMYPLNKNRTMTC